MGMWWADGLAYLFSQAQPYAISPQAHGNPDTNGNGIGVKFVPGGNNGRDTYVTGLTLPAIARAEMMKPGSTVPTGSLPDRGTAIVIQDTVDYFAHGQNDGGLVPRRLALLCEFRRFGQLHVPVGPDRHVLRPGGRRDRTEIRQG